MLSAIQNVVRENGEASALIVIIMAHGLQGRIWATDDSEVPIQDILLHMQAALPHGEPKVRIYLYYYNVDHLSSGFFPRILAVADNYLQGIMFTAGN